MQGRADQEGRGAIEKNPSPYFEEKVTLENTKSRVEVKKEERKILHTGTGGQYKRVQV